MAAPAGNDFNMKFKTSEERKALCDDWCLHLTEGFTRESFPRCDPQTFRRYMRDFPDDFDTQKIKEAEAYQIMQWEKRLHRIADTNEGNATAVIFGLKNIAGWRDKQDIEQRVTAEHDVKIEAKAVDKFADILDDYKKD